MNLPELDPDFDERLVPKGPAGTLHPNDEPDDEHAVGYCIECDGNYTRRQWWLRWCGGCQKYHTVCPNDYVPLEFQREYLPPRVRTDSKPNAT
jgi:hypothetical protein